MILQVPIELPILISLIRFVDVALANLVVADEPESEAKMIEASTGQLQYPGLDRGGAPSSRPAGAYGQPRWRGLRLVYCMGLILRLELSPTVGTVGPSNLELTQRRRTSFHFWEATLGRVDN